MELQKIQNILNKDQKPIFFLSPVLSRALGLEKILTNFHLITTRKDPLISILRQNNISVFCLEELEEKEIRNSFQLLSNSKVQDFIKEKSLDLTPNVLTFRSLPQVQQLCKNLSYNYCQADPYLVRELEDKVFFYKLLEKNNIPTIPNQLKVFENCEFKNKKMVLQLKRGFAGNSSFIIETLEEFQKYQDKYKKHRVKLTEFLNGKTLTVNACVTDNQIKIGPVFEQIDKIKELNSNELGTSGNSHFLNKELSAEEKLKIYKLIDDISGVLFKKKYRGFFGLDLLLTDDGEIYPIECNPRLTASVGNFTQMELEKKQVPLLLFHLLHFLDYKIEKEEEVFIEDLNYIFLIFRNTKEHAFLIRNEIKTGIYKIAKDKIVFIRSSIDFTECQDDEIFILATGKNIKIYSGKEYAYVLMKKDLNKDLIEKTINYFSSFISAG